MAAHDTMTMRRTSPRATRLTQTPSAPNHPSLKGTAEPIGPRCRDPGDRGSARDARAQLRIVIERNLDVVKSADWVVDLGPEGGDGGGKVIVEGSPDHVAKTPESQTGRFLASLLGID